MSDTPTPDNTPCQKCGGTGILGGRAAEDNPPNLAGFPAPEVLRASCEHGYYDGHPVLHGLDCGLDCEYEHRTDDVCPGGREIVLLKLDGVPVGRRTHYDFYHDDNVWVEGA